MTHEHAFSDAYQHVRDVTGFAWDQKSRPGLTAVDRKYTSDVSTLLGRFQHLSGRLNAILAGDRTPELQTEADHIWKQLMLLTVVASADLHLITSENPRSGLEELAAGLDEAALGYAGLISVSYLNNHGADWPLSTPTRPSPILTRLTDSASAAMDNKNEPVYQLLTVCAAVQEAVRGHTDYEALAGIAGQLFPGESVTGTGSEATFSGYVHPDLLLPPDADEETKRRLRDTVLDFSAANPATFGGMDQPGDILGLFACLEPVEFSSMLVARFNPKNKTELLQASLLLAAYRTIKEEHFVDYRDLREETRSLLLSVRNGKIPAPDPEQSAPAAADLSRVPLSDFSEAEFTDYLTGMFKEFVTDITKGNPNPLPSDLDAPYLKNVFSIDMKFLQKYTDDKLISFVQKPRTLNRSYHLNDVFFMYLQAARIQELNRLNIRDKKKLKNRIDGIFQKLLSDYNRQLKH